MNDPRRAAFAWILLAAMLGSACRGILGVKEGAQRDDTGGGTGGTGSGGTSPGGAVSHRSCDGLSPTCGPNRDADCCASGLLMPGGDFLRSYDGETYRDDGYPAGVSPFYLDTYEVTVGRFRKFVEAYPGSKPTEGSGKNPKNPDDPGWDRWWSPAQEGQYSVDHLPATKRDLMSVLRVVGAWTDSPGENENYPMSDINWYVAFAFCIWDGGRLPTEAEWNYAAAGGDEQRVYPWGDKAPARTNVVFCDESDAGTSASGAGASPGVWPPSGAMAGGAPSFDGAPGPGPLPEGPCLSLSAKPEPVGSKSPDGDGKWHQSDLAGNVAEWTLDQYIDPYTQVPCFNCSNLAPGDFRVTRGGSYLDHAPALLSSYRKPATRSSNTLGMRCARNKP